jgi:CheY-like chemotaxis protein
MKPIQILLVEDNEGDILLTTEALEDSKIIKKVNVVTDGKLAIDFLNQKEPFQDALMPNLILLDINLPKKNGHEVLKYLKSSTIYRHIPVIILTTSSSEKDILEAYRNYANCFITKPVEVNEFMKAVAKIETFWIGILQLP